MEFRIQPDQAEVVTWLLDQGAESIQRYKDCAIRDTKNWKCSARIGAAPLVVTDGKIELSLYEMIALPQIYKWQWHLLDFGMFRNKFSDWSKQEIIGDWFGFPSLYTVFEEARRELERRRYKKTK